MWSCLGPWILVGGANTLWYEYWAWHVDEKAPNVGVYIYEQWTKRYVVKIMEPI
jgi:hypothetical protein